MSHFEDLIEKICLLENLEFAMWKYCFLAFLLMNKNIAYICYFIVCLKIFVRSAQFSFEIYSSCIWRVPSWKESGSLLFSSPKWTSLNKFYWKDEPQTILANPLFPLSSLISFCPKIKKLNLIEAQVFQDEHQNKYNIITNNMLTNNNRKLSHWWWNYNTNFRSSCYSFIQSYNSLKTIKR